MSRRRKPGTEAVIVRHSLDSLIFKFYRLRFRFRAASTLYFPPYKSANILRGAFGSIFHNLVCVPGCVDAKSCDVRATCPYANIFEPGAACGGERPSGLADWPRPFVFRASHLDGNTVGEGESFHFDVHIFNVRDPALEYYVLAFAQLAREGLGPGRGKANLAGVDQLDLGGASIAQVADHEAFGIGELAAPAAVDLGEPRERVNRVRVRFVTPTELKTEHHIAERPEFAILFARLRDRISTLRLLYDGGPLDIDFRAVGERAKAVGIAHCQLKNAAADRISSRTGQQHSLGGFVGDMEYEGDLGEFMPYLRLARWVGVGRQTVWGKGELEINPGTSAQTQPG